MNTPAFGTSLNLVLVGIVVTSFFGTMIGVQTGVEPWHLYPFVGGIILLAWAPLVTAILAFKALRDRVAALERASISKGTVAVRE